jgi:uncharacterized caspase-like protein
MTAVVQATCPGCKKVLRLPADWINQSLRCKHCGMVVQAKPKASRSNLPPVGLNSNAPIKSTAVPVSEDRKKPAEPPMKAVPPSPARENYVQASEAVPTGLDNPNFADLDDPDEEPAHARFHKPGRPHRRFRAGALIVSLLALMGTGVAVSWAIKHRSLDGNGTGGGGDGSPATLKGKGGAGSTNLVFPRRAFIVSVNNYLYANPVNHGVTGKGKSPLLERLRSGLHIPSGQIAELSDAAPGATAKPPLKAVIESNLAKFLGECRPQDRALVFFIGHAVEKDDQVYLMPIEGEVDEKETLIPLTWLYERLEKSPARQKVLVLDVARLNLARGLERPGSGPVGEKLDAALQNPPAGVQVWSACVKGQYSYEFEDGGMNDGLFSHSIQQVFNRGLGGVIQKPEDAMPLTALMNDVNRTIKGELEAYGLSQTSRLSGQVDAADRSEETDETEPAEVVVEVPRSIAEGAATRSQVATILKDIAVPPIKAAQEDMVLKFETLPPFSRKIMEDYGAVGGTSPLREAVEAARDLLQKLNTSDEMRLQEEFRVPANETAFKTEMTNKGKGVAHLIGKLQGVLDDLKSPDIAKLRSKEPKRWQANYDYMVARVEAEIAYLFEYASMLGKLKKELPPRDPAIHNGWRLASQPELEGDRTGQTLAKDANKILDKIIKNNPGTPWAVLAKRDKLTALGLKFVPTK